MFTNTEKKFNSTFTVDFFQFMDAYNILDRLKKRPIILSLFALVCQRSQALPCTDTDPEIFQRRGRG